MTPAGRSRILRLSAPMPYRARAYWLRRIVWLGMIAALVALAWLVVSEALPKSGAALLLYRLHDHLWVPLKAWVWTRSQGGAILWLTPIALLLGLLLLERLGLFAGLRKLQVLSLRLVLRSPLSAAVLGIQQLLGWRRGHEGMVLAVIDAELTDAFPPLRAAQLAGGAGGCKTLMRLTAQRAYLRGGDPKSVALAIEALAMARDLDPTAHDLARQTLLRIWQAQGHTTAVETLALAETAPDGLETLLGKLYAAQMSAIEAAAATLAFASKAANLRPDLVQGWFTEWARHRHRQTPDHMHLREAESLIDFAHWAALAETRLAPAPGAWMSELLSGIAAQRNLGERAAAGLKDL